MFHISSFGIGVRELTGEQILHRNSQNSSQLRQDRHIGATLSAFPFGDGFSAHAYFFRQTVLRHVFLQTERAHQSANFFLIHTDTSFVTGAYHIRQKKPIHEA
jgi:hypothetical protein